MHINQHSLQEHQGKARVAIIIHQSISSQEAKWSFNTNSKAFQFSLIAVTFRIHNEYTVHLHF